MKAAPDLLTVIIQKVFFNAHVLKKYVRTQKSWYSMLPKPCKLRVFLFILG